MKMQCPQCNFNGEFKKAKVPFFIFNLLDSDIAAYRAKRTFVCPHCRCKVERTDITTEKTLSISKAIFLIVIVLLICGMVILLQNH